MAVKELISTITVGTAGAATIDVTNIPQNFTDLSMTFAARGTHTPPYYWENLRLTINGATSSFVSTLLAAGASSPYSANDNSSSVYAPWAGAFVANNATANVFSNGEMYFANYTSSNTKAISSDSVSENAGEAARIITAMRWNGTAPITGMSIYPSVGTWIEGTTISIYGIRKGTDTVTKIDTNGAGGNLVVNGGGYTYHTFLTSGTFSAPRSLKVEALVIGGGGGGAGGAGGGGGGAGGFQLLTGLPVTMGNYSVIVGAGGTNGTGGVVAGNGGDSSFLDITSFGGAGGGQTDGTGRNGASGSGNGSFKAGGGLGIAGQGNNGGDAGSGSPYNAGGGGGAGAAGSGMNGGVGSACAWGGITGTGILTYDVDFNDFYYFAGGGGGGTYYSGNSAGSGGNGGGGAGTNSNGSATSGTPNTGGGGGGSGNQYNNGQGSMGGSGIVIIRYPTPA